MQSIHKVLVANRGEIACRIIQAAQALGIETVAIFSEADQHARHVRLADEAYPIGPSDVNQSYLNKEKLIAVAQQTGCDAVHPGYGLLSEKADFAKACEEAGLIFIGPNSKTIAQMGDKAQAKALAKSIGVPVIESITVPEVVDQTWVDQTFEAEDRRYLVKACAGGGGKGMRLITADDDPLLQIELAKKEAQNFFADSALMLEQYIAPARHIEVQILADHHGTTLHLFDRDCSLQRRYQKVIEEAPAYGISDPVRQQILSAAVRLAEAVHYTNAGTVEFLLDAQENFYFLEMNTRVQVEHCVTEMITGEDIVQWQFKIADRQPLNKTQVDIKEQGVALEARLCAEIPEQQFMPSTGYLKHLSWPQQDGRIDHGYAVGDQLTPYYDSLLAKIIVWAETRTQAIKKLTAALNQVWIEGIATNRHWLVQINHEKDFLTQKITTQFLNDYQPQPENVLSTELLLGLGGIYDMWQDRQQQAPIWQKDLDQPFDYLGYVQDDQLLKITVQPVADGDYQINHATCMVGLVQVLEYQLGCVLIREAGDVYQVYVHSTPKRIVVRVGAQECVFYKHKQLRQDTAGVHSGALQAPLPGVVSKVLVQQRQAVNQGDALVLLEAMKMEHDIKAPFAGVVASIAVAEGDRVALGEVLVSLLPQPENS